MRLVPAAVAIAVVLAAPSGAAAAQRYASPDGSGTSCSQAAPCSLQEAITKAAGGDEVIVGAGTYSVSSPLFPPLEAANVYIHGDLAAAMPRIVGETGGVPIGVGAGTHLSYLDISNTGPLSTAAICNPGGLIDRVRLLATGDGATALSINGNCTTRDSLVRAEGHGSIAVFGYGYSPSTALGTARNLTAIATGDGSMGILARYTPEFEPGSYTLDLKNSIASGELADLATGANAAGPASIAVSNSNFDLADPEGGPIGGAADQTAPPIFAAAASGDYREAPGSPTIDAGVADGIGSLDLEGNPRTLGAAPDIGAFELVPPSAQPLTAVIRSLKISPGFRPWRRGGPVAPGVLRSKPPVGGTVTYGLSAPGVVDFSVERGIAGRRVGGRCRRRTAANRDHRRCLLYRPQRGGFTQAGAAGKNAFVFSGRLGGKRLRAGRYRLVARAGGSSKRAPFRLIP